MINKPPFTGIAACVFDAYGTLFDVHTAVGCYRERLGTAADAVSALWRSKQLEYTWLRSLMGRHADFWTVTAEALDFALDAHGLTDPLLHEDLMQAYLRLDCYPEVPGVLATLHERGLRLAILTNGSPAMIDAAVANSDLQTAFDALLSVEEVGIYKPDPRVYQLAVDRLGTPAGQTLFLSSNGWDVAGAACFGFRVAWVNRSGVNLDGSSRRSQPPERLPCGPDAVLDSLHGLPELIT